jgi:hypothetical protein
MQLPATAMLSKNKRSPEESGLREGLDAPCSRRIHVFYQATASWQEGVAIFFDGRTMTRPAMDSINNIARR